MEAHTMALGIDPADRHYRPRLQEALADELYRRSAIPQLLFVPVLFMLYFILQSAVEQRPVVGWMFVVLACVMVPRMGLILGGTWLRRRYPDPSVRIRVFAVGSALVGVVMGTINLLAAPVLSVEQVVMLAIIASGISSVNIVSMNSSLPSYFLTMLPNFGTIPFVVAMGPPMEYRNIFLVLLVINIVSVVIMATYVHIDACKAILLRIKVDDANAMLQSEVDERLLAERSLALRNEELQSLNERLAGTQSQLLQSEKMASIGQLAAGVAHEINNPIAFVRANLISLKGYVTDMLSLLDAQEAGRGDRAATGETSQAQAIDIDFLREDIPALLVESIEGVTRVEKIVKDLKEFSHLDKADWLKADLHHGIETTLNVAAHELKYKVEVIRDYGELPLVECLPFQLNQVFLNLVVNAAQSIEGRGTITISTGIGISDDSVWIRIADTGKGIEPAHLTRIFEPFFTTKPVGIGTGLGLSVSYSIIRRHGGSIEATSELGKGTEFTIRLPVVCRRGGQGID
jgi:signal transduction histidine kinase